ncbi:MAG: serine/threonine-protein kinase, partial [Planctomycetota bacterium]
MEPPLRIPGYRIEAPIARGAQGAVYRAIQLSLDRAVALKVVPEEADDTGARLLAKEAKVLAGLDHPNIVRVFDHGRAEGCSYMAMELLEGVDLGRHLESLAGDGQAAPEFTQSHDETVALDRAEEETVQLQRGDQTDGEKPVPAKISRGDLAPDPLRRIDHVLWTLEIAAKLCDAMATVHAAGVLHRDLKPANIVMVEGRGPVITDFGTVHAPSRASYTQALGFVGTPAYMSPEQANERELDRRSDLYSLAATIYHCLAGRSPFAERSLTAVLIALERSEPEALRGINPAVPLAFAKVIGKGMAKDVRDRFADIGEFSAALEKVRRGEKLGRLWTIPGMYRRTRRWHLPAAAAMVLGLGWYFWQDPSAVIRELIVADDLEQAVVELGFVP